MRLRWASEEDRRAVRALLREALEAASGDPLAALDWLCRRAAREPHQGPLVYSVLFTEVMEDGRTLEECGIARLPAWSRVWREATARAADDPAKALEGFLERLRTDPALLDDFWAAMMETGLHLFADVRAAWERERQA